MGRWRKKGRREELRNKSGLSWIRKKWKKSSLHGEDCLCFYIFFPIVFATGTGTDWLWFLWHPRSDVAVQRHRHISIANRLSAHSVSSLLCARWVRGQSLCSLCSWAFFFFGFLLYHYFHIHFAKTNCSLMTMAMQTLLPQHIFHNDVRIDSLICILHLHTHKPLLSLPLYLPLSHRHLSLSPSLSVSIWFIPLRECCFVQQRSLLLFLPSIASSCPFVLAACIYVLRLKLPFGPRSEWTSKRWTRLRTLLPSLYGMT